MGHRDLLVTHNLSEGKTHEPRPYLRGNVRRTSGFVLTGYPETDPSAKIREPKQFRVKNYVKN